MPEAINACNLPVGIDKQVLHDVAADRAAHAGYKNVFHLIPRQHACVVVRFIPADIRAHMSKLHAGQIIDLPGDAAQRADVQPGDGLERSVERDHILTGDDEHRPAEAPARTVVDNLPLVPATWHRQIPFFNSGKGLGQGVFVEPRQAHAAVVQPHESIALTVFLGRPLQPLKLVVLDGVVLH